MSRILTLFMLSIVNTMMELKCDPSLMTNLKRMYFRNLFLLDKSTQKLIKTVIRKTDNKDNKKTFRALDLIQSSEIKI